MQKSEKLIDGILFRSGLEAESYLDLKEKHTFDLIKEWEMDIPINVYVGRKLLFTYRRAVYYERAGLKIIRVIDFRLTKVLQRLMRFACRTEYILEVYPQEAKALEHRCLTIEGVRRKKNENRTKI